MTIQASCMPALTGGHPVFKDRIDAIADELFARIGEVALTDEPGRTARFSVLRERHKAQLQIFAADVATGEAVRALDQIQHMFESTDETAKR